MSQQSDKAPAFVTKLTPGPTVVDTNPSDQQPPGVDEDIDYESLEEDLTS